MHSTQCHLAEPERNSVHGSINTKGKENLRF